MTIACDSSSLLLVYVNLFKIFKTLKCLKHSLFLCCMFSTTVLAIAALQEVSFSSTIRIVLFEIVSGFNFAKYSAV